MKPASGLYPQRSYRQFVPQESGLHRHAVFALYRALLSQCSKAPFDDVERDALKHVTRNRFQANRHLRTPRRLKLSFYAGYKALDYLDDAVAGEQQGIDRITEYLLKVPESLKRAPKRIPPPPKGYDRPYETPSEYQFFNSFPREHVEGERRVPHFVRANGFPMVRWKKPQPENLTRTITGLIKGKQKNHDYQLDYEQYHIPMARNEDAWDSIVEQLNVKKRGIDEGSWFRDAAAGLQSLKSVSQERQRRTMEKARRMVEIIEREQELADKEAGGQTRGDPDDSKMPW